MSLCDLEGARVSLARQIGPLKGFLSHEKPHVRVAAQRLISRLAVPYYFQSGSYRPWSVRRNPSGQAYAHDGDEIRSNPGSIFGLTKGMGGVLQTSWENVKSENDEVREEALRTLVTFAIYDTAPRSMTKLVPELAKAAKGKDTPEPVKEATLEILWWLKHYHRNQNAFRRYIDHDRMLSAQLTSRDRPSFSMVRHGISAGLEEAKQSQELVGSWEQVRKALVGLSRSRFVVPRRGSDPQLRISVTRLKEDAARWSKRLKDRGANQQQIVAGLAEGFPELRDDIDAILQLSDGRISKHQRQRLTSLRDQLNTGMSRVTYELNYYRLLLLGAPGFEQHAEFRTAFVSQDKAIQARFYRSRKSLLYGLNMWIAVSGKDSLSMDEREIRVKEGFSSWPVNGVFRNVTHRQLEIIGSRSQKRSEWIFFDPDSSRRKPLIQGIDYSVKSKTLTLTVDSQVKVAYRGPVRRELAASLHDWNRRGEMTIIQADSPRGRESVRIRVIRQVQQNAVASGLEEVRRKFQENQRDIAELATQM
jgi:hypothetical protein